MWLRRVRAEISVFVYTLWPPEFLSSQNREETVEQIQFLAKKRGLNPKLSEKVEFSSATLKKAPAVGGVYHFYQGDQLRYVGVASNSLQGRLRQYLSKVHNQKLADLIASGEARVAWYTCPYPGWMEDYELTQYPHPDELYNMHKRGNRIK
jgi:hypothetical protein